MNYTVNLTDTAKQDLREIAIWIAQKSRDIEAAKNFVQELREECKKLIFFPDRGLSPKTGFCAVTDIGTLYMESI